MPAMTFADVTLLLATMFPLTVTGVTFGGVMIGAGAWLVAKTRIRA